MADQFTPEALVAQAALSAASLLPTTQPTFAYGLFDDATFDAMRGNTRILTDIVGIPLTEVALRNIKDPADSYEIARAEGGQDSITGTQGLTAAELAAYPSS